MSHSRSSTGLWRSRSINLSLQTNGWTSLRFVPENLSSPTRILNEDQAQAETICFLFISLGRSLLFIIPSSRSCGNEQGFPLLFHSAIEYHYEKCKSVVSICAEPAIFRVQTDGSASSDGSSVFICFHARLTSSLCCFFKKSFRPHFKMKCN